MTASSPTPRRLALLPAVALLALLSACGGGGDTTSDTTVSAETTESVSANSLSMTEDSANAASSMLATAQAVVAGAQASQTHACAGGGTAVYTVSGGSLGGATNGQLDAGEVYSLQFHTCVGSAGAASVDGTMTLEVTAASAGAVTVQTSTQGVVVALPQRTLTLDGSSTLAQTVVTNGATSVTTNRWTSPQITLTSLRNARASSLTLSGVDFTRSVTTTGAVVSGSAGHGTLTLAAALPNGSWTAEIATQGTVSHDANGVPTAGSWQITLPHNLIGLQVGAGTATVTVDHGPDGAIDHTYTFSVSTLSSQAV